MKNRDHSLTLEGLIAAQSRLSAGHSILPVLAAKQGAVEAGIGGEEPGGRGFSAALLFIHQPLIPRFVSHIR